MAFEFEYRLPFINFNLICTSQFMESHRRPLWVWNQDTEQQELAGFVKEVCSLHFADRLVVATQGGSLRLVLVRNAGHSVPLNQPQWTLRLNVQILSHPVFSALSFRRNYPNLDLFVCSCPVYNVLAGCWRSSSVAACR